MTDIQILMVFWISGYDDYTLSDATIDFMNHYKLVDSGRVDMYARAFVVNDEDLDFSVNARVG